MRLGVAVLAACIGGAGCSASSQPPIADAAIPSPDAVQSAIAAPAEPVLTPCPAGWRQLTATGSPAVCDPWPDTGHVDCAGAEAHFPGEPGCMPIGSACPSAPFPADLPGDRAIVYVLAGSTAGDGSLARPFGSIAQALAVVPAGGVVAIGKGTYDEAVTIGKAATLHGACAAETLLRSSAATTRTPVVDVLESGVELRDLSIGDSPGLGLGVRGVGAVRLEGVVVSRATGVALSVLSGSLDGHEVVLRDTLWAGTDPLSAGNGIVVNLGGAVHLVRVALERNVGVGVSAIGAAAVTLEDAVVFDTLGTPTRPAGYSLMAFAGGEIVVQRGALERAREFGVFARGDGSSVRLEDVVLRDTAAVLVGLETIRGRGLIAFEGADAFMTRVLFERNTSKAIQIRNIGSTLELEDAVVRDTQANPGIVDFTGIGLDVHLGGDARVTRALFERNTTLQVAVDDGMGLATDPTDTSMLALDDVVIRDPIESVVGARAIQCIGDATIDAHRIRIERTDDMGVLVSLSARVSIEDIVIEDVQSRECSVAGCAAAGGIAVGTVDMGALLLRRFAISRAALCGALVARNGSLDLAEGRVTDSTMGACVQVDGYDLSRLTNDVVYERNGRNLEVTDLPVPEVLSPF